MLLSIIIVSYNTAQITTQAIESVLADITRSDLLSTANTDIWVVDNNSTDHSVKAIKELAKKTQVAVHLIENKENLGFARANNQAIGKSNGEFVLLLNSDTVVQPQCLNHLISTFKSINAQYRTGPHLASNQGKLDQLGLLAAQLLNIDGSVQPQGGDQPSLLSLAGQWLFLDDLPFVSSVLPSTQHTGRNQKYSNTSMVAKGWVAATAVMTHRQMLAEIGDLDQNIFMYGEDVEWSHRAQAHHWDVAIATQAQVTHLGNASSNSNNAIKGEIHGYLYIWQKHFPRQQFFWAKLILLLGTALRYAYYQITGKKQLSQVYWEACLAVAHKKYHD